MLIKVGAYVAAGDRNKLLELRQLAEAAGATFDSCLMKEPLLKSLGNAAKLRKLACDGQVNAALDIARAQRGSRIRTDAFTLIAEGMAGAFGLSGEPSLIDVTLAGPPGQLLRP
jgi:hypothetical protein